MRRCRIKKNFSLHFVPCPKIKSLFSNAENSRRVCRIKTNNGNVHVGNQMVLLLPFFFLSKMPLIICGFCAPQSLVDLQFRFLFLEIDTVFSTSPFSVSQFSRFFSKLSTKSPWIFLSISTMTSFRL